MDQKRTPERQLFQPFHWRLSITIIPICYIPSSDISITEIISVLVSTLCLKKRAQI